MSVSAATSPSGLVAQSIVLPVLGIVATAMRLNLRRGEKSPYRISDLIVLPALVFFLGMCICSVIGVDRHVWGFPSPYPEANTNADAFTNDTIFESKSLEAYQFLQIMTLGFIKLAAILFYRRIFCNQATNSYYYDITISSFIVIVALWMFAMLIMNGLQCGTHMSALWATDPSIYIQYCLYVFPSEIGFAISNFLLGFVIILLPIPKSQSGSFFVSELAFVGFAGSIARMVIYLKIDANGPSLTADYRLEDTKSVFWSNLEAGLEFLAMMLPSLWAYVNTEAVERIVASVRTNNSRIRSHGRIPDNSDPFKDLKSNMVDILPDTWSTSDSFHTGHVRSEV